MIWKCLNPEEYTFEYDFQPQVLTHMIYRSGSTHGFLLTFGDSLLILNMDPRIESMLEEKRRLTEPQERYLLKQQSQTRFGRDITSLIQISQNMVGLGFQDGSVVIEDLRTEGHESRQPTVTLDRIQISSLNQSVEMLMNVYGTSWIYGGMFSTNSSFEFVRKYFILQ